MSASSTGPAHEQSLPPQRTEPDPFSAAIGALTEGAACFPVPFDLATSAALRENDMTGDTAVGVFAAARSATARQFHIRIHEVIPGQPTPLWREVVDCVLDQGVAAALLDAVAAELDENQGETSWPDEQSPS